MVSASQSTWHLAAAEIDLGIADQQHISESGVTRAEYLNAVSSFAACLERHRLRMLNDGWNPVDNRSVDLRFGNVALPDNEVTGYGNDCKKAYLEIVESNFRSSTTPVMDTKVMSRARECMTAAGIKTTGSERSLNDLTSGLSQDHIDTVVQCVTKGAQEIFPGRVIYVRDE